MYKRFQQFISVAMALLVLISTLSLSIEKHYCGDHLVDVAFFTDVQKCGTEVSDMGLEASDADTVLTKNSCCKDVVDLLEGQDELSLEKTKDLNTNQKVFIMSFASVFSGLNLLEPKNSKQFEHYSPPKVVEDIQILNEVFLI